MAFLGQPDQIVALCDPNVATQPGIASISVTRTKDCVTYRDFREARGILSTPCAFPRPTIGTCPCRSWRSGQEKT